MARWLKILVTVVGILLIVISFAGFQSYVLHYTFSTSLYEILSKVISELWKFVSTPTIFVAGLVFLLLWHFRRSIDRLFPGLKEITAGGVSAKFDLSDADFTETPAPASTAKHKLDRADKDGMELAESYIRVSIIERLAPSSCRLFLGLDQQRLTISDLVDRTSEAQVQAHDTEHLDRASKRSYYFGAARAIWAFVIPHLFSTTVSPDKMLALFVLKPHVRDELQTQLKKTEPAEAPNQ